MIELNIATPDAPIRINVDGRFACDVVGGIVFNVDRLHAEVRAARALTVLPKIVRDCFMQLLKADRIAEDGKRGSEKHAAFAKGLCDGWTGLTSPHGSHPDVPPTLPAFGAAYERGYAFGEAVRKCAELVDAVAPPAGCDFTPLSESLFSKERP